MARKEPVVNPLSTPFDPMEPGKANGRPRPDYTGPTNEKLADSRPWSDPDEAQTAGDMTEGVSFRVAMAGQTYNNMRPFGGGMEDPERDRDK